MEVSQFTRALRRDRTSRRWDGRMREVKGSCTMMDVKGGGGGGREGEGMGWGRGRRGRRRRLADVRYDLKERMSSGADHTHVCVCV